MFEDLHKFLKVQFCTVELFFKIKIKKFIKIKVRFHFKYQDQAHVALPDILSIR